MLIVAVVQIKDISEPEVQPGTGFALYNVAYQALIWVPFRGEVVDGRVTSVLSTGIFTEVGGTSCFVTRQVCCTSLLPLLGVGAMDQERS